MRLLQARFGFARHGPASRLDDHINVAGLNRWKTLCPADRDDLSLVGPAQNGRGQRAAEIDVKALPFALAIDIGKAKTIAVSVGAKQECATPRPPRLGRFANRQRGPLRSGGHAIRGGIRPLLPSLARRPMSVAPCPCNPVLLWVTGRLRSARPAKRNKGVARVAVIAVDPVDNQLHLTGQRIHYVANPRDVVTKGFGADLHLSG